MRVRISSTSAKTPNLRIEKLLTYNYDTEIKTAEDLLPSGAAPGAIPTDLEQAVGLERLEILGKMQGIDVFDMRPLDASRKGTGQTDVN